ncbi:MAG: L,D-transpeptidase [Pseudomonadota bacterium]|nr:L,D-transpeptidase [Pseudomonadota bacterium]
MFDFCLHVYFSVRALFSKNFIVVDVGAQKLFLYQYGFLVYGFDVSTAALGTGEMLDSQKTPRGWFKIRQLYGDGATLNTIFKGRAVSGYLSSDNTDEDPVLARIVRLGGLQFRNVNTFSRYIYIHGARRSEMDRRKPLSSGCVRMYCDDVALLYDLLYRGGLVYVVDSSNPLPCQTCFVKLH